MVEQPGDYRWSSYRHNALGQSEALLTPHYLYERLDTDVTQRCAVYRALFSVQIDPVELNTIRSATETGAVLGNGRFEVALKRRIERLPHGGGRKGEIFRGQRKNI